MSVRAPFFDTRRFVPRVIFALVLAGSLTACSNSDDSDDGVASPELQERATANLALLSTTDLHFNVRSYDYFKLADDPTYGFERTATLIRAARREFPNTLLVDNGDTIQGTALADYEAQVSPIPCTSQSSVYKAIAVLQYDAGTLGNHEFNYGLPFLNQVLGGGLDVEGVEASLKCAGPGFPMTLANVTSTKSGKELLPPYVILEREISATQEDGDPVVLPIKIGVVGLTTPGIMNWDKRYLEGKITVGGGREAASDYVAQAHAEGADLVVVLLHGGMSDADYSPDMENPGLYVAQVPGIDGLVMGHQHNVFPDRGTGPAYSYAGVDNAAGTVHGVPAVMASSWGKGLGVIDYALQWDGQAWHIEASQTKTEVRSIQATDADGNTQYVEADPAVAASVQSQHEAAVDYVKTPVGTSDFRMSTLFADVGDAGAIQLVNQAQQAYVSDYVAANLPQYASLPVLSISAPFKAGFQGGGDYTDVAAGALAIYHAADLYLYPNTVYAVKVSGAELKLWLENAALRFNRIDPSATQDQWLIKDTKTGQVPAGQSAFAGYNFDMFTSPDLQYEIDVTQPQGSRIKNLAYRGEPVGGQDFIVATNNYRAESSARYILGEGKAFDIVYALPDANRDVVINYIKDNPQITRSANGSARSWRFTPVNVAGAVLFKSGKGSLSVAQAAGLTGITLAAEDDGSGEGRAVYRIDLSQTN
ncbi:bifunctional 2',3'-cyclic-nucleotide 2'-phosphodiesterase/3'-nucleotidase [Bordetella sp. BOR01]|uniref:bifunctional 2',3'-cyclic-nucleotide 2'-phosphodiesterase/3'-nucleotidase n=1 Tax=Bordetella sp. BOR01 TaxID=2854779 RepID=UPI001C4626B1|nr:bifunctional 2',3'-cyclic-nucleotide 2'-phosphodiesterase/3'-nucleotidase [Bordetella sp. BOR01]MBV7486759.1 bifunctional 2',3'-cyclic-nucleotide 2'-phosphodiesterase/3'-nucleotidase [Bordetella sp. BOR01]